MDSTQQPPGEGLSSRSIAPLLKPPFERVAARRRQLQFWSKLAACWLAAALFGLALIGLQRQIGWRSPLALPVAALLGFAAALGVALRHRRAEPDWHELARQIESGHADLQCRLLTAAQQHPKNGGGLNYLQQRLLGEALAHNAQHDWAQTVPKSRIRTAQLAHWLAVLLFGLVLWGLRATGGHRLLARWADSEISVTPGDTSLERGSSLVVLARFNGPLPATVDLVVASLHAATLSHRMGEGQGEGVNSVVDSIPAATRRIPLVKSLADPMFGGSVPDVSSNLLYHVEYAGQRTRDFKVAVFEYPRLERADADLTFPDYTGQPPKRVENTRRLSAVEGSRLDLDLEFNKPVVSARLVARDQDRTAILVLAVETNRPVAMLKQFPLEASRTYELQLLDADGRTNKTPAQFVFNVLKNRPPELRLASPSGDLRPSPLEEIPFEGTVWDDFGVRAYGLAYALAGQETKFVQLGAAVPADQKRAFKHLLRLEDLGVQPDQLLSWFLWADDIGPDGLLRRATGDLFFAEVRPFEEIFREGQGMDAQQQGQAGQQESPPARLAELQKQIITATWKLQREHGASPQPAPPGTPVPRESNSNQPVPERVLPTPRHSQATNTQNRSSELRVIAQNFAPAAASRISHHASRITLRSIARNFAPAAFAQVARQPADDPPPLPPPSTRAGAAEQRATTRKPPAYEEDAAVVRESQAQVLRQAQAASQNQQDPRSAALWGAAVKEMEQALDRLNEATNSAARLADARAAEQAAYQALLRLQEHEFQVVRARNRQQRGGSREQQMQRQLEQMDLTESENRYETQRQAQPPQSTERREQSQAMSRLQELARRQQDLNDRLKELQAALQEAHNDQEREAIRRRLKRLQEEEQQMLADVDELRQRMDRPENQSSMADERRQLDQTRDDIQAAAEAAAQGAVSQAVASGTRAQRQLQQLREQMRKENSSQFAEDLRQMRAEARELARRQADILNKMQTETNNQLKTLSGSSDHQEALDQLPRQQQRLTNLLERATQVSQQAEDAEPLLSRQLYDTVRKFRQDTAHHLSQLQEELLNRGRLPRSLYERLKDPSQSEGAKLLDLTSEMLRQDFLPEAIEAGQRAGASTEELKHGVEQAAQSILGDDTEALRLAQQELDRVTDELQREQTQPDGPGSRTNQQIAANTLSHRMGEGQGEGGRQHAPDPQASAAPDNSPNATGQGSATQSPDQQPADAPSGQSAANSHGLLPLPASGARGEGRGDGQQTQTAQEGRNGATPRDSLQRGGWPDSAAHTLSHRMGEGQGEGTDGRNWGDGRGWNFDRFWNPEAPTPFGPLTGPDFGPWSDRLRDVEEMIDIPELRNQVATARERARLMRQEFKRDLKKPDWAVVRLQVMKPLIEVRDRITDELARRRSPDALVPIDRDPVPERYSELVRRYYEELGKDR